MTIKNKTNLRREIKSRVGNTGSLDNVWIDPATGEWIIHSSGTTCPGMIKKNFLSLAVWNGWDETVNQAITRNFLDLEVLENYEIYR